MGGMGDGGGVWESIYYMGIPQGRAPLVLPPFETNGSTLNRQGGGDPGPFRGRYCAEMYY